MHFTRRLFNAFGIVVRFLHIQSSLVKNISIDQMRCLLRPNTGIDIELCIACKKLGLPLLEKHFEEFLISGLSLDSWVSVCKYASSYSSVHVLSGCYTFVKRYSRIDMKELTDREGAVLTDEEKTSEMEFSDSLLFNPSTQKFYYLDGSVSASVFDCTIVSLLSFLALLKQDVELRSSYLSPGFYSSGNTPCSFDSMTEEELQAIGKKKKNCGFKGTVRCYLERITSRIWYMK